MDQDADEPSDERGVADGAFTNGRSIAATRLSQTLGDNNNELQTRIYLHAVNLCGAVFLPIRRA